MRDVTKSSNISGCHRMVLVASQSPMVTFPSSRRYWPPVSRSERGVQGAKERERARAAGFPLPVRSRGYVFGIWGCVFGIWGCVFGIWCYWFGICSYWFVILGCQFPTALHILSCGQMFGLDDIILVMWWCGEIVDSFFCGNQIF